MSQNLAPQANFACFLPARRIQTDCLANLFVADQRQGVGLSMKMVDCVLEICKDMKFETIYAIMLPDNYRAISLMKKMGFTITYVEDGTVKGALNLK